MPNLLLTWSDRGVSGPTPAHHARRPTTDRGPVLRLLDQPESKERYQAAWVLTTPDGVGPLGALLGELEPRVGPVEARVLELSDPSDYARLFRALGPLCAEIKRRHPPESWNIDVLLSAGTPQAQTLWVILVQAGILPARMLQVVPAVFVPSSHPRAIREVRLDIDGFPEVRALRAEVSRLRAREQVSTLIGDSEPMRRLVERVSRVAASDVSVLIGGETGSGKELVARALHAASERAAAPFVAESCAALADSLLESELFGHESGAFTGTRGRKRGLFELAHGGTLFLDEVGEMTPRLQAALLRVLQEGVVRRVGGEQEVRVDVRVVAATHRDLAAMVKTRAFREDLFYRLRGATLEVPPLRARPGDVDVLLDAFLAELRVRGRGRAMQVSDAARTALSRYAWPGNVRELRAEVVRWTVFSDGHVGLEDLAPEIVHGPIDAPATPSTSPPATRVEPLADLVAAVERQAVTHALEASGYNLVHAAAALGIDRNTLKRKMARYRLKRPRR